MKKINRLLNPIMAGCIIASPLICITSCGGQKSNEAILQDLVATSIHEFKELGKHPRASTMLKEIQMYLLNWAWKHNYLPMMDEIGNIWFDVNATSGCENYPRVILQGHMDMVFAYDLSQTGEGKKDVPDPKSHMIELEEKIITEDGKSRKVIRSKDQFTSIGADDGIGVAMILAIIQNQNISHGPLRVVFTTDEEEGLVGAKGLSRTVFEGCNHIINFDGEGEKNAENIICNGCSGFCEYQFKHEFDSKQETKLSKSYELHIEGLRGGHYMDETYINYTQNGSEVPANADRIMLEVLNRIQDTQGINKSVQIQTFIHKNIKGEEINVEARQLPNNATIFINTDYEGNINDLIATVINDWKEKYKQENWDNVTYSVVANPAPSEYFLDSNNTKILTQMWGKTIHSDILEWEGNNDQEKIAKNYPALSCNVSSFRIAKQEKGGEKMVFSVGARGMANTVANLETARDNFLSPWKSAGWDEKEITTIKYYSPWDTSDYHKLIDLANQEFQAIGITPVIKKTRGGVEPAFFSIAKPGIEQVVIGPRIDSIHTPKETLYIDSIASPIAVAVLMLKDIVNLK